MASPEFEIELTRFEKIDEIPGAWTTENYRQLLVDLDVVDDGVSDEELSEFCLMCLQDREPADATAILLRQRLSTELTVGQIQNLAIEFADEKHWEHYADLRLHKELFNVGSLAYRAFPEKYNEPEAANLSLEISGANPAAKEILNKPLDASFLLRALASGLSNGSILLRLFDDQLQKGPFPESNSIIWCSTSEKGANHSISANVISSVHWLGTIRDAAKYQSNAFPDKIASAT